MISEGEIVCTRCCHEAQRHIQFAKTERSKMSVQVTYGYPRTFPTLSSSPRPTSAFDPFRQAATLIPIRFLAEYFVNTEAIGVTS